MTSLREQRQKNIENLVNWLKSQFPKILEKLRSEKYWDSDVMSHVSFDELSEFKQYALMGARVREALRTHIQRKFMFSHATQYNYVKIVMVKVGCVYKNNRWFCRLKPRET